MVHFGVRGNGVRRGRGRRATAGIAAATVVALLLAATPMGAPAVVAAPARSATPAPAEPAPAALEAPDEASAGRLAYRTRREVLVTGMTTQTSLTYAQPDGSFRSTLHLSPMRIRRDGGWVDVDLKLERRPDGTIRPKAHPGDLVLSASRPASSEALVAVGWPGERFELGWRGALPEPVLDRDEATYREVRPGIDLVVRAQRTGFEYFLVVKRRSAAAEVASVAMPLRTGGLRPVDRVGGGVEFRDAAGAVVAEVPPAQMWDAVVSPVSGDPIRRTDVPFSVDPNGAGEGAGTDLVLRPARAFLDDPATVFPVTVDPSVGLRPMFDAFVQNTISSDQSGSEQLKLGYVVDADEGCASACRARSFLSFGAGPAYWDAKVTKAELFLWNYHSYSCNAAEWQAWVVDFVDASARWNRQPAWLEKDGVNTATRGYNSSCGDDWVSVYVPKVFQRAFTGHAQRANVGLRAASESSNSGWKKFDSAEGDHPPHVEVTYNRRPAVPTNLAIDSCYSACASPAVVRSGTPRLSARVSDPDGGTLRTEYQVFNRTLSGAALAESGTAVTGVASGTAAAWRVVPKAGGELPDGQYNWRARACDVYQCGEFTGFFAFTVDTANPDLPTVAADPYAAMSTGTWNGGPGVPGTFTFAVGGTAAGGTAQYSYQLGGGSVTRVGAGAPQAELLTPNQQTVATNLAGFGGGGSASVTRSTVRGHNSGESLQITPVAAGGTAAAPHVYASVGGDSGGMALGMRAGRRYLFTGWIYVPAATGLAVVDWRALALVPTYRDGGGYHHVVSPRPTATDTWQKLSVVMTLPASTTEAFLRVYNGFPGGSGKTVFWDDLSARELTGTTTIESVTPARDGVNTLSVQSIDAAGNLSDPRIYQFLVRPVGDLTWYWSLDQGTGTSAPSAPTDNRPAAFAGSGAIWSPPPGRVGQSAVTLTGAGNLETASPVLDTTHTAGFTVAAWVRLTDLTATRTAVSQDGPNRSMFRLGYRTDRDVTGDGTTDQAWCFSVAPGDAPDDAPDDAAGDATTAACTTDYVVPDDWVHLVGVYDRPGGKLRLYVNGSPDIDGAYAEAGAPTPWAATGTFAVGRARAGAAATERWIGELDEVYAEQHVWSRQEIDQAVVS